ncbi:hypothetical protein KJ068_27885 [bacterium]|nr:hypothetical protein [bacterium]
MFTLKLSKAVLAFKKQNDKTDHLKVYDFPFSQQDITTGWKIGWEFKRTAREL